MTQKFLVVLWFITCSSAQLVDDFSCPDEFIGFYPHLISCDKYWSCQNGIAELKTCGNGLAFMDTDDTFTLEQCAELHLVECGERTEIEPPISTRNCPRLYGTFADPEDCGVFYKCMDGIANRYNCPPGLAYDQVSRGCRWADQVPECSSNKVVVSEDGDEFQCPKTISAGTFTKHAHPADCRQYFLCIGGVPREYGCPLGSVFNEGTGNGLDGKCSDPEEVPECAHFYEGVDLDPRQVLQSGFDSGLREPSKRIRTGGVITPAPRRNINRPNPNSARLSPSNSFSQGVREQARPIPPSLQQVISSNTRQRPSRPLSQIEEQSKSIGPNRGLIATPIPNIPQRTPNQNRLQILTDRPNLRSSQSSRLNTIGRQTFSTTPERPPTSPPTTSKPVIIEKDEPGLPAPVKAAPGPNGEEYYYYYYYYDDEDEDTE